MTESKLRELIRSILQTEASEKSEEELEEITVTGDVAGYNTPFAFDPEGKKKKKKKKIGEALEEKDIKIIRKLIRDVIGDVYRDIWIKRTSWK